jgi:hypothetical protein
MLYPRPIYFFDTDNDNRCADNDNDKKADKTNPTNSTN